LLSVELVAPPCAGLPAAFSAELEEDAGPPSTRSPKGSPGPGPCSGPHNPRASRKPRSSRRPPSRLPIGCIRWAHPSNWNASRGHKSDPSRLATKWPGINEM
jgi:hypothetical protein